MGGKIKKGGKGRGVHIYLPKEQEAMLDAIAQAMGVSRIGIEPSRSQLIVKAVSNYIKDCREDALLKRVIDQVEIQLLKEKGAPEHLRLRPLGPKVM